MKKPVVFFTTAGDPKNLSYAKMCEKSFKHFHPDIPFIIYGPEFMDTIKDPLKFYKQKPLFARDLLTKYEVVVGIDADSLVLGSLDDLWNDTSYDVAGVLNINRVDPMRYGYVQLQGIPPQKYLNCGLVAMRSKAFVDQWWRLCNDDLFANFPYKEQDLFNILFHFGDYQTKVLDYPDKLTGHSAWYGLVNKGETIHSVLRGTDIVIPVGKDNYPDKEVIVKVFHFAGGQGEPKMDYQKWFPEDVIKYIDGILK